MRLYSDTKLYYKYFIIFLKIFLQLNKVGKKKDRLVKSGLF